MRLLITTAIVAAASLISFLAGQVTSGRSIEIPDAEWTQDSAAGESWRRFAVSLEAAGARVFQETDDPRERLEGLQYLAQLASASLEMKVAKGDEANPAFTNWMGDYRKFLGDSPDAIYKTAEISSEHSYEITGNRGDTTYLGFMLYGSSLNGWNRAADNTSSESMTFDAQGNFRLLLSREKPAGFEGDWLKLEDDIHMVMVREYFHQRATSDAASFNIRRLPAAQFEQPTDQQIASRVDEATAFFNDTLGGAIALISMLGKTPNSFDAPKEYNQEFGGIFYPTFDNLYFGGWISPGPDQAIVIEGKAPDVDYWSVSLQNRWMQSFDYAHFNTTLNNKDIEVDASGNYRIVISEDQLDEPNWLDMAGNRGGLLSIRYQLATEGETPKVSLVPMATLSPSEAGAKTSTPGL